MNSNFLETNTRPRTVEVGTMRVVEYENYGDANVLHAGQQEIPERLPEQILIEVHASSVNPVDYRFRRGDLEGIIPFGFPRVPGYDVAGVVAECDSDAPFAVGDRVMAFLDYTLGGALADFAVCGNYAAAKIPDRMSMQEAAAIPLAGTTALQSLRDYGKLQKGERVLINGASGGVGMFAVQIAKGFGCHVDAVASIANREFCLSLGADHFYDYESTSFLDSDERWDVIFDVAGKASYMDARSVLNEGGRFVSTEPSLKGVLMSLLSWPLSKSGKVMLAKPSGDDLRELVNLYELGKITVTIDSVYPFEDAAAAHQRVEDGVDRGKVILTNKL